MRCLDSRVSSGLCFLFLFFVISSVSLSTFYSPCRRPTEQWRSLHWLRIAPSLRHQSLLFAASLNVFFLASAASNHGGLKRRNSAGSLDNVQGHRVCCIKSGTNISSRRIRCQIGEERICNGSGKIRIEILLGHSVASVGGVTTPLLSCVFSCVFPCLPCLSLVLFPCVFPIPFPGSVPVHATLHPLLVGPKKMNGGPVV